MDKGLIRFKSYRNELEAKVREMKKEVDEIDNESHKYYVENEIEKIEAEINNINDMLEG